MRQKLFTNAEISTESETEVQEETVLSNLKLQYSNSNSKAKNMIVICLPETWSIRKIMREFNGPNYMVRKLKKLLQDKGFQQVLIRSLE